MSFEDRPRFTLNICKGPTCPTRLQSAKGEQAVNSFNIVRILQQRIRDFLHVDHRGGNYRANLGALIELDVALHHQIENALLGINLGGCTLGCKTGRPLPRITLSHTNFSLDSEDPIDIDVMGCETAEEATTKVVALVRGLVLDVNTRL